MTGFEPVSSGFGSDRAANCAKTTALVKQSWLSLFKSLLYGFFHYAPRHNTLHTSKQVQF